MSTYVSNRNSDGLTDENGHYRFLMKAFTGNILSGLKVEPSSPASMSLTITAGDAKVPYSDYGYSVWSDSSTTVSITTSDANNPRIDSIVGYVDRSMAVSSSAVNNPNMFKFMVVAGTPNATPSAPSASVIQNAVGAGNPYIILADVNVAAGSRAISSTDISVARRQNVSLTDGISLSSINANGSTIEFKIISANDPLPSAKEGVTQIVFITN